MRNLQRGRLRPIVIVLSALAALAVVGVAGASRAGAWTPTGSMVTARSFHTATRLHDGRVLVTGGFDVGGHAGPPFENDAELYDPHSETWTPTAPMSFPRAAHMAVKLKDGRVLVAGGEGFTGTTNTAEIYDPRTETWTPAAPMLVPHEEAVARLLQDGRVLVAGGDSDTGPTSDSETYNPQTGTWTPTQPMPFPVTDIERTAASLRNDSGAAGGGAQYEDDGAQQVLVAGGCAVDTNTGEEVPTGASELFDMKTNTWRAVAPMPVALCDGAGALLKNGDVLIAGGASLASFATGLYSNVAELYDVKTGAWTVAAPMASGRNDFTITLLKDGRALAAGGHVAFDEPQASSELYDPKANVWTPAGTMSSRRAGQSATLLKDGNVLVAGGLFQPPTATQSADLFRVNNGQG
jgi:N-acetylneuraminic acid mutarotase